jgi:hypothetical protein
MSEIQDPFPSASMNNSRRAAFLYERKGGKCREHVCAATFRFAALETDLVFPTLYGATSTLYIAKRATCVSNVYSGWFNMPLFITPQSNFSAQTLKSAYKKCAFILYERVAVMIN